MWVEEDEDNNGIVLPEQSTPRQNLSGMRRNHSEESFACIPESSKGVGSTKTLAKSKSHTDCSKMVADMSDQHIMFKNNGKPTIDAHFFRSMAKTIKAKRASKAGAEVVDEKAFTHYTGHYTPDSCGVKTRYVNWIEGEAMRVRIELKFGLLHERMLTSGKPTPGQNLSGMRRNHSEESFACIPESNKSHSAGSTKTLEKSKSHTDCSKMAADMSDQHIMFKNNGKPTIDAHFFKSMAKTTKAKRAAKAGAEVVDEKAFTHYTGLFMEGCLRTHEASNM
jgi:hypothetical protein